MRSWRRTPDSPRHSSGSAHSDREWQQPLAGIPAGAVTENIGAGRQHLEWSPGHAWIASFAVLDARPAGPYGDPWLRCCGQAGLPRSPGRVLRSRGCVPPWTAVWLQPACGGGVAVSGATAKRRRAPAPGRSLLSLLRPACPTLRQEDDGQTGGGQEGSGRTVPSNQEIHPPTHTHNEQDTHNDDHR